MSMRSFLLGKATSHQRRTTSTGARRANATLAAASFDRRFALDRPGNTQWQSTEAAKEKDRTEQRQEPSSSPASFGLLAPPFSQSSTAPPAYGLRSGSSLRRRDVPPAPARNRAHETTSAPVPPLRKASQLRPRPNGGRPRDRERRRCMSSDFPRKGGHHIRFLFSLPGNHCGLPPASTAGP
jgi:hypothetical protein